MTGGLLQQHDMRGNFCSFSHLLLLAAQRFDLYVFCESFLCMFLLQFSSVRYTFSIFSPFFRCFFMYFILFNFWNTFFFGIFYTHFWVAFIYFIFLHRLVLFLFLMHFLCAVFTFLLFIFLTFYNIFYIQAHFHAQRWCLQEAVLSPGATRPANDLTAPRKRLMVFLITSINSNEPLRIV